MASLEGQSRSLPRTTTPSEINLETMNDPSSYVNGISSDSSKKDSLLKKWFYNGFVDDLIDL